MTRRLKSRNRKYAGDRTYGGGNKKNRRGKGSRGGRGRAGYHKHKWMHTIKYEFEELREKHHGFHNITTKRIPIVTLERIDKMLEKGKLEKKGAVYVASFPNHKVLATGSLHGAVEVTARAFSAGAKEKIEKSGGKAVETNAVKDAD